MARRWARFVMPVMVEVDCDEDEVLRAVTLPEELRADRDDGGDFLIYDENFVVRRDDEQPQTHAFCVAEAGWEHDRFRVGSPLNWPGSLAWEEGFDLTEADDRYAGVNPYGESWR